MSEIKTDKLSPRTGAGTVTLGTSGDSYTIPAGVTLTNAGTLTNTGTLTNSGTASGFGLFSSYAIIADQKAQNTDGGTYTNGDFRTHDLNTEIADPDGIVSIASNQFTLGAGTYLIKWVMELGAVIYAKSRLYNITDTAVSQIGMTGDGRAGENLTGIGRITITGSTVFEIQLRGTNTVTSTGFGFASLFATEQYMTVEIYKEA
jgi:hypothetical protein